jgi:hypothetical protein
MAGMITNSSEDCNSHYFPELHPFYSTFQIGHTLFAEKSSYMNLNAAVTEISI